MRIVSLIFLRYVVLALDMDLFQMFKVFNNGLDTIHLEWMAHICIILNVQKDIERSFFRIPRLYMPIGVISAESSYNMFYS